MACMYPRHFCDLPILWDDPAWVVENEVVSATNTKQTASQPRPNEQNNESHTNDSAVAGSSGQPGSESHSQVHIQASTDYNEDEEAMDEG
uniref:Uncharacterized protein n=1 Tax=Ditylenchus dipsaci TaxID=166011 RepID=A0A915CVC0_9BILA